MFGEFVSLHKVFYVIFSVSVFFIVHDFQYKLYFCLIYHVYVATVRHYIMVVTSDMIEFGNMQNTKCTFNI